MSVDFFQSDGMVRVVEHIEHYRYVPSKIYEITQALYMMSEENQIKVMKYITRITGKHITFRALAKPKSTKSMLKAMAKMDRKLQERS